MKALQGLEEVLAEMQEADSNRREDAPPRGRQMTPTAVPSRVKCGIPRDKPLSEANRSDTLSVSDLLLFWIGESGPIAHESSV